MRRPRCSLILALLSVLTALTPLAAARPPRAGAAVPDSLCRASIAPTADTTAKERFPDLNLANDDSLGMSTQAGYRKRSFVRFDTNLPAYARIERATITLTTTTDTIASSIAYRVPSSSWTETNVTWNRQPSIDWSVSRAPLVVGRTITFDVTSWITPTGPQSFVFTRPPSQLGDVHVQSSESATAAAVPRLDISYGGVSRTLVPSCGVWLGSTDSPKTGPLSLAAQEQVLNGNAFDLAHYFMRGATVRFPDDHQLALVASGHFLHMNWKLTSSGVTWRDIANGAVDAHIRAEADYLLDRLATVARPEADRIFLTIHHESEDEVRSGDPAYGTAADYRAMFRRVRATFTQRLTERGRADAVVWVFTFMGYAPYFPTVDELYPGDDAVDWIAIQPYNWAGCRPNDPWRSFAQIVADGYRWADGHNKPIMVGETGTEEGAASAKGDWFRAIPSALATYPKLRAIVYFNADRTVPGVVCNWTWNSSTNATAGFQGMASDQRLNPPHR